MFQLNSEKLKAISTKLGTHITFNLETTVGVRDSRVGIRHP